MDGGFREALLRQDGIEPGTLPAFEREKLNRLLAREHAGIRWLRWGTVVAWILTIAVYVASGVQAYVWQHAGAHLARLEPAQTAWQKCHKLFVLRIIMPIEAAALSAWLYFRNRSASRRRLRAALLACETELQELSAGKCRPAGPAG